MKTILTKSRDGSKFISRWASYYHTVCQIDWFINQSTYLRLKISDGVNVYVHCVGLQEPLGFCRLHDPARLANFQIINVETRYVTRISMSSPCSHPGVTEIQVSSLFRHTETRRLTVCQLQVSPSILLLLVCFMLQHKKVKCRTYKGPETRDDSDTGIDGLESCAWNIAVGPIILVQLLYCLGGCVNIAWNAGENTVLRTWSLVYLSSCARRSTADSSVLWKIYQRLCAEACKGAPTRYSCWIRYGKKLESPSKASSFG